MQVKISGNSSNAVTIPQISGSFYFSGVFNGGLNNNQYGIFKENGGNVLKLTSTTVNWGVNTATAKLNVGIKTIKAIRFYGYGLSSAPRIFIELIEDNAPSGTQFSFSETNIGKIDFTSDGLPKESDGYNNLPYTTGRDESLYSVAIKNESGSDVTSTFYVFGQIFF